METNALPHYDASDNPTDCCPRFRSEGWDEQELHFRDKRFVEAHTRSAFHVPLNMGRVFTKTMEAIAAADAWDEAAMIVLSHDPSPWSGEHLFAANKDVPGQQMTRLSGDYLTKVFEGPYKQAPQWEKQMAEFVAARGKSLNKIYFFYTTCPKCAKEYGENYVVAVAQVH